MLYIDKLGSFFNRKIHLFRYRYFVLYLVYQCFHPTCNIWPWTTLYAGLSLSVYYSKHVNNITRDCHQCRSTLLDVQKWNTIFTECSIEKRILPYKDSHHWATEDFFSQGREMLLYSKICGGDMWGYSEFCIKDVIAICVTFCITSLQV